MDPLLQGRVRSERKRTRSTIPARNGRGSLVVVGTGIQLGLQLTVEARDEIEIADEVLHVVADPIAATQLESLNRNARSLTSLYRAGVPRRRIYEEMVEEILGAVRERLARLRRLLRPPRRVRGALARGGAARARGGIRGAHAPGRLRRGLPRRRSGRRPGRTRLAELGGDRLPPPRLPSRPDGRARALAGGRDREARLEPRPRPARPPGAGGGARRALSARARAGLLPRVDLPDRSRGGGAHAVARRSRRLDSPPAPTLYVPPLPSRPVDAAMAARIGVTPS